MLSSKCNLSPGKPPSFMCITSITIRIITPVLFGFALNRDPSGGVFGHTAGDQVPGASHGVKQVHPVLSTDNRFRGTRGNGSKGVTPHRGGAQTFNKKLGNKDIRSQMV